MHIRTAFGDEFTVEGSSTDQIQSVKKRIQDQRHIPAIQQRLFHDHVALEDRNTLQEYHLTPNCILDLVILDPGSLRIHIEDMNGRRIPLEVRRTETIAALKQRLQDQQGIPVENQTLFLLGRSLGDSESVQGCGVGHNCTLYLVHRPTNALSIRVELESGKIVNVKVDAGDDCWVIKQRVREQAGIDLDGQFLYFGGCELMDTVQIWGLPIRDGMTLHLARTSGIAFSIYTRRQLVAYPSPDDLIQDVKDALEGPADLPWDLQKLVYHGRVMENGQKFGEFGVAPGETIHIVPMLRG
jgi:ubiquitin C